MTDVLQELACPFPATYVHTNPSGGGSYVKHHVIVQRLIQVLGIPPSFTLVEVVRGDVAAIPPNPNGKSQRAREGREALTNVIVAVVARLQVEIDGETVVIDEAGDCEEPHNWTSDGQRLKDAMSDAYKRCAMRIGCGLHLWSQDEYFLHNALSSEAPSEAPQPAPSPPSGAEREQAGSNSPPGESHGTAGGASATPPVQGEAVGASPSVPDGSSPYALIEDALDANLIRVSDVIRASGEFVAKRTDVPAPVKRADFASLPPDVLEAIAQKLDLIERIGANA